MKALFQSRPDLLKKIGGDTIQILKTKGELEKLGYEITIDSSNNLDLSDYDIVHVFNLQTFYNTFKQVLNAKKQKKYVVLSSIWWDFKYMDLDDDFRRSQSWKYQLCEKIFNMLFFLSKNKRQSLLGNLRFKLKNKNIGRKILDSVDWVLPNSNAELEILVQDFQMPILRGKSSVVVNAIDDMPLEKAIPPSILRSLDALPDNFVLCVGRIEPVKGQKKIIQALMDLKKIPIVFIGRGIESDYGQSCKKLANIRGNVYFISQIEHDYLYAFYRKARVHVLPSLRESPGLVSLEAARSNTNIVTSIHAPIWEYFQNYSFVCNPQDIQSIKKEILRAYNTPFNPALKEFISENFTWKQAAQQTAEAYEHLKVLHRINN